MIILSQPHINSTRVITVIIMSCFNTLPYTFSFKRFLFHKKCLVRGATRNGRKCTSDWVCRGADLGVWNPIYAWLRLAQPNVSIEILICQVGVSRKLWLKTYGKMGNLYFVNLNTEVIYSSAQVESIKHLLSIWIPQGSIIYKWSLRWLIRIII